MKKTNYDFFGSAKKMPPLCHSTTKPFDITKSEVAIWLAAQPEIMQKLFDIANTKGLIRYDSISGKWQGVDFND